MDSTVGVGTVSLTAFKGLGLTALTFTFLPLLAPLVPLFFNIAFLLAPAPAPELSFSLLEGSIPDMVTLKVGAAFACKLRISFLPNVGSRSLEPLPPPNGCLMLPNAPPALLEVDLSNSSFIVTLIGLLSKVTRLYLLTHFIASDFCINHTSALPLPGCTYILPTSPTVEHNSLTSPEEILKFKFDIITALPFSAFGPNLDKTLSGAILDILFNNCFGVGCFNSRSGRDFLALFDLEDLDEELRINLIKFLLRVRVRLVRTRYYYAISILLENFIQNLNKRKIGTTLTQT
jgi:hypothetical protein